MCKSEFSEKTLENKFFRKYMCPLLKRHCWYIHIANYFINKPTCRFAKWFSRLKRRHKWQQRSFETVLCRQWNVCHKNVRSYLNGNIHFLLTPFYHLLLLFKYIQEYFCHFLFTVHPISKDFGPSFISSVWEKSGCAHPVWK